MEKKTRQTKSQNAIDIPLYEIEWAECVCLCTRFQCAALFNTEALANLWLLSARVSIKNRNKTWINTWNVKTRKWRYYEIIKWDHSKMLIKRFITHTSHHITSQPNTSHLHTNSRFIKNAFNSFFSARHSLSLWEEERKRIKDQPTSGRN